MILFHKYSKILPPEIDSLKVLSTFRRDAKFSGEKAFFFIETGNKKEEGQEFVRRYRLILTLYLRLEDRCWVFQEDSLSDEFSIREETEEQFGFNDVKNIYAVSEELKKILARVDDENIFITSGLNCDLLDFYHLFRENIGKVLKFDLKIPTIRSVEFWLLNCIAQWNTLSHQVIRAEDFSEKIIMECHNL